MFRPGVISVIFIIRVGIDAEQFQNGVTGEPDHYGRDQRGERALVVFGNIDRFLIEASPLPWSIGVAGGCGCRCRSWLHTAKEWQIFRWWWQWSG